MRKVKRTYNLSPEIVSTVKSLVEESGVAPTQDALVEAAVSSLARRIRDQEHARQFARCAEDPGFRREMETIAAEFEADDRAAWDRG